MDIFGNSNNDIKFNLKVLSLGAGVQSSVMLLMADRGLLGEKPDVAILQILNGNQMKYMNI
jgi:hypothetical protein